MIGQSLAGQFLSSEKMTKLCTERDCFPISAGKKHDKLIQPYLMVPQSEVKQSYKESPEKLYQFANLTKNL